MDETSDQFIQIVYEIVLAQDRDNRKMRPIYDVFGLSCFDK
jgi:hypothetical protein